MTNPVDLNNHKAFVAVFAMDGCGACEEFLPVFLARVNERRGDGFLPYEPGRVYPFNTILVAVYDAASPDPELQRWMDAYQVSATPTTLVLKRGHGSFKVEGELSRAQIDQVLDLAKEAAR